MQYVEESLASVIHSVEISSLVDQRQQGLLGPTESGSQVEGRIVDIKFTDVSFSSAFITGP